MFESVVELASWQDLIVYALILWATTGLTLIHLGVLSVQGTRAAFRYLSGRSRRVEPTPVEEEEGPLPDLSFAFLVAVYNDALTIGPCIDSLLSQSVRPAQVVVVNDGSTDETAQVLEQYRSKGVTIVTMPRNSGKSHALEAALPYVTTDLVAITDADSLVDRDYVRQMLLAFGRNPDLKAIGGAVESIPHTWITAARQVDYMLTVGINRNAEHHMNTLVVLPGVSSTYRTTILKQMGYDHDTIAEDFDLTFRMHKAGHKIGFNLKAKVYTSDPPTLKSYYRQMRRWNMDFWMVVKKHRDVLGKRAFGTVEVPLILLNTTLSSVLFLGLPVYFALYEPHRLWTFLIIGTVIDTALVVLAHKLYKRTDVYWSLLSRYPTRVAARWSFLVAMTRVLSGRPGMEWGKLERRRTDAFLAKMGGQVVDLKTPESEPPAPPTPGSR
ncbi:MAG TPA: glycosyltransferase [Candidatus Thermoplasmatota archaeon]|nr:glycosyltransferase [Candidatus Thermoplasmatota archaeon]